MGCRASQVHFKTFPIVPDDQNQSADKVTLINPSSNSKLKIKSELSSTGNQPNVNPETVKTEPETLSNDADGYLKDDTGLLFREAKANSGNLLTAAKRGDLQTVVQCIQNGDDVNMIGMWNSTPLIISLQYGYDDICHYLLEQKNINVNHLNEKKAGALVFACMELKTSLFRKLIQLGANIQPVVTEPIQITKIDEIYKCTPLSLTAICGTCEMMNLLLGHISIQSSAALGLNNTNNNDDDAGSNTDTCVNNGISSNDSASIENFMLIDDFINTLFPFQTTKSIKTDKSDSTLWYTSSSGNSNDGVSIAKNSKNKSVRSHVQHPYNTTPLMVACAYGNIQVIQYLLGRRKCGLNDLCLAALDSEHSSMFHHAVRAIDIGNNDDKISDITIHNVITDGSANNNSTNRATIIPASQSTPLPISVCIYQLFRTYDLLKLPLIHQQDLNGNTPLHLACDRCLVEVCRILLHAQYVNSLINVNGKVNNNDNTGHSSNNNNNNNNNDNTHGSSSCNSGDNRYNNHIRTSNNAHVNIRNCTDGWTCLHIAVRRKQEDIIQVLLQHGADAMIEDNKGLSALQMAQKLGKKNVNILIIIEKSMQSRRNSDMSTNAGKNDKHIFDDTSIDNNAKDSRGDILVNSIVNDSVITTSTATNHTDISIRKSKATDKTVIVASTTDNIEQKQTHVSESIAELYVVENDAAANVNNIQLDDVRPSSAITTDNNNINNNNNNESDIAPADFSIITANDDKLQNSSEAEVTAVFSNDSINTTATTTTTTTAEHNAIVIDASTGSAANTIVIATPTTQIVNTTPISSSISSAATAILVVEDYDEFDIDTDYDNDNNNYYNNSTAIKKVVENNKNSNTMSNPRSMYDDSNNGGFIKSNATNNNTTVPNTTAIASNNKNDNNSVIKEIISPLRRRKLVPRKSVTKASNNTANNTIISEPILSRTTATSAHSVSDTLHTSLINQDLPEDTHSPVTQISDFVDNYYSDNDNHISGVDEFRSPDFVGE